MKVEIELTDREAELLKKWYVPAEHCGPTLQERIDFLIEEQCDFLAGLERRRATSKLYTTLGLPDPHPIMDDDIPF